MTVDNLNLQSLASLVSQYQRQINTVIVVLLVLYLLALSADLIWRIVPEPQAQAQNFNSLNQSGSSSRSSSANGPNNVRELQRLDLFGKLSKDAPVVKEEAVTDAPETRLNLVLAGVVATTSPEFGTAIIENKGTQEVYGVGEKIEGTKASLRQVQKDRVIIRNNGRDETLMLVGIDFEKASKAQEASSKPIAPVKNAKSKNAKNKSTKPKSSNSRSKTQPKAETKRLSNEAVAATKKLRGSPDSFIDFIRIAPKRKDNETIGYTVSPGKDPALFTAVGLETGDVITLINGLDVTDASQTIEALGVLRSADSIELTIDRKDEVLTLFLELPEATDS